MRNYKIQEFQNVIHLSEVSNQGAGRGLGCRGGCSLLLRILGEHLPQSDRLVSASRQDYLAIRRKAQRQHTLSVASQLSNLKKSAISDFCPKIHLFLPTYLFHGGKLPNVNLVIRVSVSRHNFLVLGRPQQRAHLRLGVDGRDAGSGARIPKPDVSVGGAASRGQNAALPRTPGQRLDGRLMRPAKISTFTKPHSDQCQK
jgi:hypothetical protein